MLYAVITDANRSILITEKTEGSLLVKLSDFCEIAELMGAIVKLDKGKIDIEWAHPTKNIFDVLRIVKRKGS